MAEIGLKGMSDLAPSRVLFPRVRWIVTAFFLAQVATVAADTFAPTDAYAMQDPAVVARPYVMSTAKAALAGGTVQVDVYQPRNPAATGVAVLAHGFMRDRSRNRDLAEALVRADIIAVAPDLPQEADASTLGESIATMVRELERGALGLPPTPRAQIVLIGTSAGGLATVIAASRLPGLGGWIGLDPVDQFGAGARAAKQTTAPAVVLLGDASVCNLFGSGKSIAQSASSLVRSERLRGASHCDFEGPTNNFCRTVCGGSSSRMADKVRSETVAAALEMLSGARSGDAEPDSALDSEAGAH